MERGGFSGGSSSDRLKEEQENEIAENIYDWWISGKSYKQWYAEKYLQQQINFDFNDETTIGEENNGMEQGWWGLLLHPPLERPQGEFLAVVQQATPRIL